MPLVGKRQALRAVFLLTTFGVLLSGCSLPWQRSDAPEPIVVPQLPPTPAPAPAPVRTVDDPTVEPPPPVVIDEPEPPPKVAIVLSSRVSAYEDVVLELGRLLEDVEIYDLSDKSLTQKDAFDTIHDGKFDVVVAVGLRAATFARAITEMPVIFSQVFNVSANNLNGDNLRGIAAIPPLEMQLKAWREINPDLRDVGAILGEGHNRLIDEALRATEANGMELHYRTAKSDRETLYLFTRLVSEIDSFWLFPDNRILSSGVLRQMMSYADRHHVQVAVFNDSLLALGAVISTTSVNEDIAQTIASVIDDVMDADIGAVPAMTSLSRISVRTNSRLTEQVAQDPAATTEGARRGPGFHRC